MNKIYNTILFIIMMLCSCQSNNTAYKETLASPEPYHQSMQKLTDVIVHDIFSPPVASRVYAYPNIAAYEVARHLEPERFQSLAGQLNELSATPTPKRNTNYAFELASIHAFLVVGKKLIFSEEKIDLFQQRIYLEIQEQGMPKKVYQNSLDYGQQVADHILAWSDKDNYKQTRTAPRYNITDDPSKWVPTPPDYMDGIEPSWRDIRPFVLDSSTQFVPLPPPPYSMEKESPFYKDMMEVYEVVNQLNEEQTAIASFWDCNPYVSHHKGHVMFATKKITPGGHWMGITKISTQKANKNFVETTEAYALVAIALADAFISCWDEKYRSNLTRPETVINENVDPDWLPILQTPPFPEYTSGHSVISASAAYTLTKLLGDSFAFIDSTEVTYGLPPRSFNSFQQAASEAAISRLYGGIHYRPAIDEGVKQGQKVGNYIGTHLQTRFK